MDHLQKLNFNECLDECIQWLEDEPFSLGPVVMGMFVAIVALQDQQKAIELGRWGLKSHPNNFSLRNNLAVAYAELGQIEDARREFSSILPDNLGSLEKTCWFATRGMLEFRESSYENGRLLYRQALKEASDQSDIPTQALTLVFWYCEEIRAGEFERAERIERRLEEMVNSFTENHPEIEAALEKFRRMASDSDSWKREQLS